MNPNATYQKMISSFRFREGSFLADLPIEMQEILKSRWQSIPLRKGKLLFREGSWSKGAYFLEKGKVKIQKSDESGKEHIIYFYTPGEFFGYRPLLCNEPHPASAYALEDSEACFISRDDFMQILDSSGILSRKLLDNLSYEFTVWINKIFFFTRKPVRMRIALSLLLLSEKFRIPGISPGSDALNISRETLSNYAGTTTETLVRHLGEMKKLGIIRTEGRKIFILKPEELYRQIDL